MKITIEEELLIKMAEIVGSASALTTILDTQIEVCEASKEILKKQLKEYEELIRKIN